MRHLFAQLALGLVLGVASIASPAGGAQETHPLRIIVFGDSLTAGYGLPTHEGFVAVLQRRLDAEGYAVNLENHGVSGDTTHGGRARLAWSVGDGAQGLLLELGANDALSALDPALVRDNLDAMLSELKDREIPVLLLGMLAPRSLDDAYIDAFDAIYPELAEQHEVPLYPCFLDGVAADPSLNQSDGLHPNAEGVKIIVERLMPSLRAFLNPMGHDFQKNGE